MKCVALIVAVLVALPCVAEAGSPMPQRYPYQGCFEIASKMHGVPLDLLLAVAATESNWDPDARSNKNSHGIMQIQWPGTAQHLGARRVAELYNPCLNIELGARYLKELLERFDEAEDRAIAAYNYGPGRIAREPSLPQGALTYVKTVTRHRARIVKGHLPASLKPDTSHTLVTFDSRARARRLAQTLDKQIDGATVSSTKINSGYAVVLAVGIAGLTVRDQATLSGMGWSI